MVYSTNESLILKDVRTIAKLCGWEYSDVAIKEILIKNSGDYQDTLRELLGG